MSAHDERDQAQLGEKTPGTELVPSERKQPFQLVWAGGNTDRAPTEEGLRKKLYEFRRLGFPGVNLGPTTSEINRVERRGCEGCREALTATPGVPCAGFISLRGGDGKSTLSTMFLQDLLDMNPGNERPILIDINTSMTTQDVINGLDKADFLKGKYWTMETLYEFLVNHPNLDKLEFNDINSRLAYRKNPQLPVIPLQLEPTDDPEEFDDEFEFEVDNPPMSDFNGEKYLLVLSVLKRYFTFIIHDFGTSTRDELTRVALRQLHMLGVLTHTGYATTQMVAKTMEMLHRRYPTLWLNTTVIFNLSSQPSSQAMKAIALEKAGRAPGKLAKAYEHMREAAETKRITSRKGSPMEEGGTTEIQTPGQALQVINEMIAVRKLIGPLELDEIVLVGYDDHLHREARLDFDKVSPEVQAQLRTVFHRMLRTRWEFEKDFRSHRPEATDIRRDQMKVRISGEDIYEKKLIYEIAPLPGQTAQGRSAHNR
jgi:MinD-like ATPase involved in chromosome partitioning or flagellar assembly